MATRSLLLLALMSAPLAAVGGTLDLNVSEDSVRFGYAGPVGTGEFNTGLLYNDESDDWLAHVGLLALGERKTKEWRLQAGLGGRAYYGSIADQDLLALGLGGGLRWVPGNGMLALSGFAYYAPDVLTGADAKDFWEAGVRLELEIVQQSAIFYVGYRKAEADLKIRNDVALDKGGHVGITIRF